MSAVLFLAVLGLRLWLGHVGPLPGDRWAAVRFSEPWLRSPWESSIASFYQDLGSPVPALIIGTLALLLCWRRGGLRAAGGLMIACTAVIVNACLKAIFGPTPVWVQTFHAGINFPSGHTTFVTAVIGYVGLICWRMRRPDLTAVALVLIAGVGPARVVGGDHLISDVIGGYMLGTAWLILAGVWLTAPERRTAAQQGGRTNQTLSRVT